MISRLLALLAALFVLTFAVGASAAALTCTDAPLSISAASSPMSDCGDRHSKKHDRTLACAPMCAAIAPHLAGISAPLLAAPAALPHSAIKLAGRDRSPDPPPPRV